MHVRAAAHAEPAGRCQLASVDDGAIIGAGMLTQLGADAVEVYVELRNRTARNAMQMGDGCAADPAGPVIPLVPLVDGASWTRFGGRLRDFAGLSIRVLDAGGRVVACGTF